MRKFRLKRGQVPLNSTVFGLEEAIHRIGFREGDWIVMDSSPGFGRKMPPLPLHVEDVVPLIPLAEGPRTLVVCRIHVDDRDRDVSGLEPGNWFLLFIDGAAIGEQARWEALLRDPRVGDVRWRTVEVRKET